VKTSTRTASSRAKARPASRRGSQRPGKGAAAKPAGGRAAGKAATATRAGQRAGAKAARTPARTKRGKRALSAARPAARARHRPARSAPARSAPARSAPARTGRWLAFIEQHGVVLASAHGPVPCIADAVAGQRIIGSWWAHPKGKAIFAALSEIDDSDDVRCFKLVDGKVTFVHRRMWPAVARLASDGLLEPARVASIQQEHMPTGEHRNVITPFPDWVPDDVADAARALTTDAARAELGAWV
jgi:hypothetical protein